MPLVPVRLRKQEKTAKSHQFLEVCWLKGPLEGSAPVPPPQRWLGSFEKGGDDSAPILKKAEI